MSSTDPRQVVRRMAAAALNAMADAAEDRTLERVPRDTTALAESLFVNEATPQDLRAQLGTNSEYAIVQHEALSFVHDDGEAKFMEKAVTGSDSVRALERAAVRAARAIGG